MQKLLNILWFFALIVIALAVVANAENGKVLRVKDGDTVVVQHGSLGVAYTCRLYGIDAPETAKPGKRGQVYGDEANKALKDKVLSKLVDVKLTSRKTYGREVCILQVGDRDINLEMVREGYAWAYKQYLKKPDRDAYLKAQQKAQEERRGLWADPTPVAPWLFRAAGKSKR